MTDIEQKALALVNEVRAERNQDLWRDVGDRKGYGIVLEALCRAIEQHEAFRREVSDALSVYQKADGVEERSRIWDALTRFIIAKPDPDRVLVEALDEALWEVSNVKLTDRELRAVSLRLNAKRGGKIVWGEG